MAKEKKHKPWSTSQITLALRERYKGGAHAFLPQVRNTTGYARKERTADALVMGLWPSRGLHLQGFEIKAHRQDWVRELHNPAKAEEICQYCDFWWIVVGDASIVWDDELPSTWGLLVPKGKKTLVAKVQAPKLDPKPLTLGFLASMIRNVEAMVYDKSELDDAKRIGYDEGYERGQEMGDVYLRREVSFQKGSIDNLQNAIKTFEQSSGLKIDQWNAGNIGNTVKLLMHPQKFEDLLKDTERMLADNDTQGTRLRDQLAALRNWKEHRDDNRNG